MPRQIATPPALRKPATAAAVRSPEATRRHAVVVIVFVRPPREGEAVLPVLDVVPEEIAEGAKRLDLEGGERIAIDAATAILEPHADRVHRLDKASLLVPVRPDQLDQRHSPCARELVPLRVWIASLPDRPADLDANPRHGMRVVYVGAEDGRACLPALISSAHAACR
jgi:hypothetical protein